MKKKYHIDDNGNPVVCKARIRPCPKSGTPHGKFDSPQEARAWSEQVLETQHEEALSSVKRKSPEEFIEHLDEKSKNLDYGETRFSPRRIVGFKGQLIGDELGLPKDDALLAPKGKIIAERDGKIYLKIGREHEGFREISMEEARSVLRGNRLTEQWGERHGVEPTRFGSWEQRDANRKVLKENMFKVKKIVRSNTPGISDFKMYDLNDKYIKGDLEKDIKKLYPNTKSVYLRTSNPGGVTIFAYDGEHVLRSSFSLGVNRSRLSDEGDPWSASEILEKGNGGSAELFGETFQRDGDPDEVYEWLSKIHT